jgi:hypothetical protein
MADKSDYPVTTWIARKAGVFFSNMLSAMVWAVTLYLVTHWIGVDVTITIFRSQVQ